MNKILFLDIDGVICTEKGFGNNKFDSGPLKELDRIIKATNCKIVISSTWRLKLTIPGEICLKNVLNTFSNHGYAHINNSIIGATPDLNGKARGDEIKQWLTENNYYGTIAIVDDDFDMGNLFPYLVKTDFYKGLTKNDANKIIDILNGEKNFPQKK